MKVLLIDGNSLINRAFFALPPLTAADGRYTNGVYGFLTMFFKGLEEYKPTHILVAFDMKAPTFRHTQYEAYKAGRKAMPEELVPQIPLLKEVLDTLQVPWLGMEGYEADDLLGTYSRMAEEQGGQCVILTGDKDALQLIDGQTAVWLTKKGISETARYDIQALEDQYALRPGQIVDLKGLMGDASDNIPGVAGVGEKTALKLLAEYGTVENLYDHVENISGKLGEKLVAARKDAFLSKTLATIDRRVPVAKTLEDCRYQPGDTGKIRALFEELSFKSLVNRLPAPDNTSQPTPAPRTAVERIYAMEEAALGEGLQKMQAAKQGAVYLSPSELSFTSEGEKEYFIPLAHDLLTEGRTLPDALSAVKAILENPGIDKIFYDAKGFSHECFDQQLPVAGIKEDIMLAEYLLDAGNTDFSMERLCLKYSTPVSAAGVWAIARYQQAAMEEKGVWNLYKTVELPLLSVLFDMEITGFYVDKAVLQELGAEFSAKIESLRGEIYALSGVENFNINSPKQLGEVLFEKLGLPKGRKTKTGYSTDNDVLEQLASKHPAVPLVIDFRQAQKFKSTYIDGLLGLISEKTGRIHTTFHQTVAATGRISSKEPNLQNIPVRTPYGRNIRKAFVARDADHVLVDADYSQIELRILAHLSEDPTLIDAFLRGEDIHTRTAAEVFGIPVAEVLPAQRSAAKAVNFGIVYGISDFGLAQNISVSRKQAGEYIEKYFARYSHVKAFMDGCVAQAKAQGYVTTMLGRRRDIPEIRSGNYNTRSFGERVAMNTPVQGSAADIIKLAMLRVHEGLREAGLRAKLILQVHDELILEAHREDAEASAQLLARMMEQVVQMKVPLLVETKIGRSWYDTK